jgi:cytochrome b561
MNSSQSRRGYTRVAIALHWSIALLMTAMFFLGEDLIRDKTGWGRSLHVSFGVAVLLLSLARLYWRLGNPPPPLPDGTPAWQRKASAWSHAVFYALMIGLPVTGWLALPAYLARRGGEVPSLFGLGSVPLAPEIGLPFGDLHEVGSNIGIAILALHVIAALKHQFVDGDDVFKRMIGQ